MRHKWMSDLQKDIAEGRPWMTWYASPDYAWNLMITDRKRTHYLADILLSEGPSYLSRWAKEWLGLNHQYLDIPDIRYEAGQYVSVNVRPVRVTRPLTLDERIRMGLVIVRGDDEE